MAVLPTQVITVAGLTPNFVAPAVGGDTVEVDDGITLEVQNTDAATHDVTVAVPGNLVTGDQYPDKTYTVPVTGELRIPMLSAYRDPADGRAHVTYPTGITGLSVAVTQRGRA